MFKRLNCLQLSCILEQLRFSNTVPPGTADVHRKKQLRPEHRLKKLSEDQLEKYRRLYPEFLPDPHFWFRDKILERLERQDMVRRRRHVEIPEFYVGSVLAVTVADAFASTTVKRNRFVGICIHRGGHGLRAWFRLRNVIDGQGIEILYDTYNPSIIKIEVLKLERRLDNQLLYLRDAPPEYSTVSFDMAPVAKPVGSSVPLNEMKVPLYDNPWQQRWELKSLQGVLIPNIGTRRRKRAQKHFKDTAWQKYIKYDLVLHYKQQIGTADQAKVYGETAHDLDPVSLRSKGSKS